MDENDKHRAGVLPDDPTEDSVPLTGAQPQPFTWAKKKDFYIASKDCVSEPPPRKFLLETKSGLGVVPKGVAGLLVASGGTGKGSALIDLACSVGTGSDWLGLLRPRSSGRVFGVFGEDDQDELKRRWHRNWKVLDKYGEVGPTDFADNIALKSLQGTSDDTSFLDRGSPERSSYFHRFKATLEETGPWDLVIIDPASHFMGAEAEESNPFAVSFMRALESLTKVRGNPLILVAHHTNKGGNTGTTSAAAARGSSALTSNARIVMNIENLIDPNTNRQTDLVRKFVITKNNNGPRCTHVADGERRNAVTLAKVGSEFDCGAMRHVPKSEQHIEYRELIQKWRDTPKNERLTQKDLAFLTELGPDTTAAAATNDGEESWSPRLKLKGSF